MIRRKLRSQSGVSILMMLLVFLVCATVGSAILTAATASVGRIAERSKTDQRYYNVISAAKSFADQIRGQTVTLHQTKIDKWDPKDSTDPDNETTFSELWITDDSWVDTDSDGTIDPPAIGNAINATGYANNPLPPTLLKDLVVELYQDYIDSDGRWDDGWNAVVSDKKRTDPRSIDVTAFDNAGTAIGKVVGKVTMDGSHLEALFANESVADPAAQWTTDLPADVFLVRVSAKIEASYPKEDQDERDHLEDSDTDPYKYEQSFERYTKIEWTDVTIREGR